MSDFRHDRSDEFDKPLAERGNPHGGHGRRTERHIEEQFETQTGHPLGERPAATTSGAKTPADAENAELQRAQHARHGG